MEFLGTERYMDGRYGWRDVSYALYGDKLEVRTVSGAGDYYTVHRYIGIEAATMQSTVAKIRELVKGERKNARGHDELLLVLRRYPYATGYVAIDEIDWPTRKVTNAGGMNITPAEWKIAFSDE